MKRCVSYSFFDHTASVYAAEKGRSSLQFSQFFPLLIRAHQVLWHGWDMLVHHDEAVKTLPYWPVLQRLDACSLIRLVPMGDATLMCKAMLWRMKPIWDGYDIVCCRDIDGIPCPKDRFAVEEFCGSDYALHIVHDSMGHAGIMGGTTTVRSSMFRNLTGLATYDDFCQALRSAYPEDRWNHHGCDQNFLCKHIYPMVANRILLHEFKREVTALSITPDRVRRVVTDPKLLSYAYLDVAALDALSVGIGVCADPKAAIAAYDALEYENKSIIRKCEAV